MSGDRRAKLRQLFDVWLDETLEEEPLPEGLDPELIAQLEGGGAAAGDDPRDLYSLWSAVTALIQEVKLQGRSFNQLRETLAGVSELPEAVERTLTSYAEVTEAASRLADQSREERERDAEQRAGERFIEALIDLRDRMSRGLETARRHIGAARAAAARSWVHRIASGVSREMLEAARAHEEGYLMSLERLDEALEAQGVREIPCRRGDDFDPKTMHAVGQANSKGLLEGLVAEVVRPGYQRDGGLLRYSEVIVSRGRGT